MPISDPSTLQLILGSLIMVVGALLQASVGFGIALFVVPLLALLNPAFVPGPMIFAALFLASIMAFRGWQAIDQKNLGLAGIGLVFGTILGALVLWFVAAENWPRLFAVLILLAVALSVSGIHISLKARNLVAAGIIAGFMGTISGIHGPPMALLYQRERGSIFRATLAVFFVMAYSIALLALWMVSLFGRRELLTGLALVPGVVAGYLLAVIPSKRLDRGSWLRIAILSVATLSAMALILRN